MSDWTIVNRDTRDTLGEGTLWSARDNAVYWVDILAPAVNRLSLVDGEIQRWPMPEPIGWIAERRDGGFIAGFQSGFAELTLEPLQICHIGDPEPHLPGNRMNDGKVDRDGHIWCGTMDMAEQQACGALYRFAPDRTWTTMDTNYQVPNGPAFSADNVWLYHSDTAQRVIYRFVRHADGTLGPREPFIRFTETDGYPDGMTVDAEGGLWVAHWDGGRISRYLADGQLDRIITLPTARITNLTFAGPQLDRLFISSASIGIEDDPLAGALFEVSPGVRGLSPHLAAL